MVGSGGSRRWAVVVCGGALLSACSHAVYHRVQPGETLYRISKAYGVSMQRLATVNHIADPSRLEVGERLRIPDARRELPVDVITPRSANARAPAALPALRNGPLLWPITGGTLSSRFGERGHRFHEGIDISAPIGTPVHAAEGGEVIYSDVLRGYGNVIIVRHAQGFATVYAHNQSNRVHEGQHVRRGEVIASVGDSGRTSGANLHFEVRYDNVARDPLYFLPPLEQVAAPPAGAHGG